MAKKPGLTPEEANRRSLAKITRRARDSVTLSHFMSELRKKGKLSKSQRLNIVNQAQLLLEMNYAHLPFKRTRHAVDPVQKLKRLKFLIEETKAKDLVPDVVFHNQLLDVFVSIRDNHTSYSLPSPFKKRAAFLPFLIEEYFVTNGERREPRYLVSKVAQDHMARHLDSGADAGSFQAGVEVLYWNGIPIRRAIELNAEKRAGSNYPARFARALDAMTIRPFNSSLPPDERWVVVTYRTADNGEPRDIKLEWRVFESRPDKAVLRKSAGRRKRHASLDPQKSAVNYVQWSLYPEPWDPETFESETFRAREITFGSDSFAYVRILTFNKDPDAFLREFIYLIKRFTQTDLAQRGLIIDVRGNGGGDVEAGERLLQLLTPRPIQPALFEFLNTPLNLEVSKHADETFGYDRWSVSIAQAGDTGAIYSKALPITSERDCNDTGQIYYGPTVLITDALCYSTTDIFAAGFQDHEIGRILCSSSNTGAGGATVVEHKDLFAWMKNSTRNPYKRLPKRMTMRVALLRSLRVDKNAERPLEELGVKPDERHYVTKDDLLHRDRDLISKAIDMLKQEPVYGLKVKAKRKRDGKGHVTAQTTNISRLDVYVDDHPYMNSRRTKKEGYTVSIDDIPLAGGSPKLVIEGYSRRKLVARFTTKRWRRA